MTVDTTAHPGWCRIVPIPTMFKTKPLEWRAAPQLHLNSRAVAAFIALLAYSLPPSSLMAAFVACGDIPDYVALCEKDPEVTKGLFTGLWTALPPLVSVLATLELLLM